MKYFLFRWWSGPWQPCSKTCGSDGEKRRSVLCVQVNKFGLKVTIAYSIGCSYSTEWGGGTTLTHSLLYLFPSREWGDTKSHTPLCTPHSPPPTPNLVLPTPHLVPPSPTRLVLGSRLGLRLGWGVESGVGLGLGSRLGLGSEWGVGLGLWSG